MVNQGETLEVLKKERLYEEELVKTISNFLLESLPNIKNMTKEERTIVADNLNTILHDSERHERAFGELIDFVLDNGETNY